MLSRMAARIITLGTKSIARLLGDSLGCRGHNTSSNIYVKAMEYLNRPFGVLNLAQKYIGDRRKGFANASDYLETWDDLDNITAINAQKDLRHPTKMVA